MPGSGNAISHHTTCALPSGLAEKPISFSPDLSAEAGNFQRTALFASPPPYGRALASRSGSPLAATPLSVTDDNCGFAPEKPATT